MELHEIGFYLSERSHLRVVDITLRCLGFTAMTLDVLLHEVCDSEVAQDRWGITEDLPDQPVA